MKSEKFPEAILAVGGQQAEYNALHSAVILAEGRPLVWCYRLTWKERLKILFGGRLWCTRLTFAQHLQPENISVDRPDAYLAHAMTQEHHDAITNDRQRKDDELAEAKKRTERSEEALRVKRQEMAALGATYAQPKSTRPPFVAAPQGEQQIKLHLSALRIDPTAREPFKRIRGHHQLQGYNGADHVVHMLPGWRENGDLRGVESVARQRGFQVIDHDPVPPAAGA